MVQPTSIQSAGVAGITGPSVLLRAEGAALLVAALVLYSRAGGSWLIFVLLLLAPDLSALGYLAGPRAGAMLYNLVHTEVLPVALALFGWLSGNPLLLQLTLIWLAHIGMDRMLGFGLKYATAFKDMHLGRV